MDRLGKLNHGNLVVCPRDIKENYRCKYLFLGEQPTSHILSRIFFNAYIVYLYSYKVIGITVLHIHTKSPTH